MPRNPRSGHTDSDGDDAVDVDLSKRRAGSATTALVNEFKIARTGGIPAETVRVSPSTTTTAPREGKQAACGVHQEIRQHFVGVDPSIHHDHHLAVVIPDAFWVDFRPGLDLINSPELICKRANAFLAEEATMPTAWSTSLTPTVSQQSYFIAQWFQARVMPVLFGLIISMSLGSTASAQLAYIPNDNDNDPDIPIPGFVSVVDTSTDTIVATIDVGPNPTGVAFDPSGQFVYVTNQTFIGPSAGGSVSVVDTQSMIETKRILVGGLPYGIGILPNGVKLYVARVLGNSIAVIDTATQSVIKSIFVSSRPLVVAVHPLGTYVYVSHDSFSSNGVSVIDTATDQVVARIALPGQFARGIAILPDGSKLYVANSDATGTLSVIDTSSNQIIHTLPVGRSPQSIAVHPAGSHLYLPTANNCQRDADGNLVSCEVVVISTHTDTVVARVQVGEVGNSTLRGASAHPDGRRVYITPLFASGSSRNVWVLDTATNTARPVLELPGRIVGAHNHFIAPQVLPDLSVESIALNLSGLSELTVHVQNSSRVGTSGIPVLARIDVPPQLRVSDAFTTLGVCNVPSPTLPFATLPTSVLCDLGPMDPFSEAVIRIRVQVPPVACPNPLTIRILGSVLVDPNGDIDELTDENNFEKEEFDFRTCIPASIGIPIGVSPGPPIVPPGPPPVLP